MIILNRDEAQQVLDALNSCEEDWIPDGEWETRVDQYDHKLVAKALEILSARLSTPEQEAVALPDWPEHETLADIKYAQNTPEDWSDEYRQCWQRLQVCERNKSILSKYARELRERCSVPPQREWQGLTDEEVKTLWNEWKDALCLDHKTWAQAIEAKLREKNA